MPRFLKPRASEHRSTQPEGGAGGRRRHEAEHAPAFNDPALEQRIRDIGEDLLTEARRGGRLLSSAFWSDKLMNWAMKDPAFKTQLFRFVDVFPTLKTPEVVHEHLVDFFRQPGVRPPAALRLGLKAGSLLKGAMTGTITRQIRSMAQRFIAGEDLDHALPTLSRLWADDTAFTITLLGEKCLCRKDVHTFQQAYLNLVARLADETATWPHRPRAETDHLGSIPRVNISIKVSSLHPHPDPVDTEGALRGLVETLRPILHEAERRGVQLHLDMEQAKLKDLIFELLRRCVEITDAELGVVLQTYLRSAEEDARRLIELTDRAGRQVTVRLVKGAYWDYEVAHAKHRHWPIPVWTRKSDSDACFERVLKLLVEAIPRAAHQPGIKLALGSHNARSIAVALALVARNDLPATAVELQMLYGMADQLKAAAARCSLRVREYVPVGKMIPGMAYLVRRLLENTSNESWLRAGFADNASIDQLLASPHAVDQSASPGPPAAPAGALPTPAPALPRPAPRHRFTGEPPRDFAQRDVRERFADAVAHIHGSAPSRAEPPTAPGEAIDRTGAALASWQNTLPPQRGELLLRAAQTMADRRDELAALIVSEAGKAWREADIEVCRAIDFCRFFAHMATDVAGDGSPPDFHPRRGAVLICPPWSSPLTGACALASAALVTGHCPILGPPAAAPRCSRTVRDIFRQMGCPADALLLTAADDSAAVEIATDPRTAVVACAGPSEQISSLIRAASEAASPPQIIVDAHGKGAAIIDASADLDDAVLGVMWSAFAHQGQAPGSCSLALVHEARYSVFIERLSDAAAELRIGDPARPGVTIGPIIDHRAYRLINDSIATMKRQARLVHATPLPERSQLIPNRQYVAPHVFADVPVSATLCRRPVFGPVLGVMKVESFPEALRRARETALTAACIVYSRKPSNLGAAREELPGRSVFLNQPITAAVTGLPSSPGTPPPNGAEKLFRFLRHGA